VALTELVGSLLVALLAAVVIGRLLLIVRGRTPEVEEVLWLIATVAIGSTALLIVEILRRARQVDAWKSRGLQTVAGLLVGLASWSTADYLSVQFDLHGDLPHLVEPTQWPECFDGGQPRLLAHLLYFMLTFFAAAVRRQNIQ